MAPTLFLDRDKCVGCYACVVACKLEHNLPPHPVRPPLPDPKGPALIRIDHIGPEVGGDTVRQYFEPVVCRHCVPAPCVEACPGGALSKDAATMLTVVDSEACTGCQVCLAVCPVGAPRFYDGKVVLCNLCSHRPEGGGKGRRTACEAACPAGAIHLGTVEETAAWRERKATERIDRL